MDKLLILGINGFTGKHIQRYLKKNRVYDEFEIVGADQQIDKISNIRYIKADLTNYYNLENILAAVKPEYIINLIGTYKSETPFETLLEINALLTRNIFNILLKNGLNLKKMLIVGTAAEYGFEQNLPIKENFNTIPSSDYGLTKSIQTNISLYYYKNFDLEIIIARPFNIIGKNIPPDLSIGSFIRQLKNAKDGDSIYVGRLNTKRDFLDISDVINAYFSILKKGKSGQIYNICSGKSYYMIDILNQLIKLSKKKVHIMQKPEFVKSADISDIYGDNTKLMHDTKWQQQIDIYRSLELAMGD